MKTYLTALLRAITAIAIGILLIVYKEETVTWITIIIGTLFFISGLISIIIYYVSKRQSNEELQKSQETGNSTYLNAKGQEIPIEKPSLPLIGIGSIILGGVLTLLPNTIISYVVYIFGATLIFCAIMEFISLASILKYSRIPLIFWLLPSVIFSIGAIAIFRPEWMASSPLIVIGWSMILYGVITLINSIKTGKILRQVRKVITIKEEEALLSAQSGSNSEQNNEFDEVKEVVLETDDISNKNNETDE